MSTRFGMPLYVGKGVTDSHPRLSRHITDIDELASFIREYAGIPKGEWYWFTGDLKNGHRCAEEVERVYALIIDVDDGMTMDEAIRRVDDLGLLCLFYASASHQKIKEGRDPKPACDRFRLIFPFAQPVKGNAWVYIYGPLCDYILGRENAFDPACKDPSRLWYAAQSPDLVQVLCRDGELLNPGVVRPLPRDLPRKKDDAPISRGSHLSDRPGDDFAAQHSWRDLVERIGCKFLRSKGGEEFYEGSHKDKGEISLTSGYGGSDVLYVFSSSMHPLKPLTSYTKFGFYAEIWHGGDHVAAARQLGKDGYGSPPQRKDTPVQSVQTQTASMEASETPDDPIQGEIDHLSKFEPTDLGNAERFVRIYGQDLRYCHLWGKWIFWNKRHWMQDDNGGAIATQKAIELVRGIAKEAFRPERQKDMGAMLEWAGKCHARARIESLLAIAKHLPGIPVTPDDLDRDTEMLNCLNGIVDLRTFELIPHDRTKLITKLVEINYFPDAKCPSWTAFIDKVLKSDPDLIGYIWKAVGYSLTGLTSEKCFFFLYGLGNNGKTVFVECLQTLMAGYGTQLGIDSLMIKPNGNTQTNDIAALKGARLVAATETEDGKRLAESTIKRLTGGDTITCRFLHQEFFSFKPHFKIWMSGNHKPQIKNTDEGMWTRVVLVPFEATIAREDRIPAQVLAATFQAEMPGILAWAIAGCKAWRAEGLDRPKAIADAVEAYQKESDTWGEFLEECTETDQFGEIRAKSLYQAYSKWATDRGEIALSMTRFGKAMRERGESPFRDKIGLVYQGRRLKEDLALQYVYRGSND